MRLVAAQAENFSIATWAHSHGFLTPRGIARVGNSPHSEAVLKLQAAPSLANEPQPGCRA